MAEAIDLMGYLQLDERLTNAEIMQMLHFMTALADIELTSAPAPEVKETGWWDPSSSAAPFVG